MATLVVKRDAKESYMGKGRDKEPVFKTEGNIVCSSGMLREKEFHHEGSGRCFCVLKDDDGNFIVRIKAPELISYELPRTKKAKKKLELEGVI